MTNTRKKTVSKRQTEGTSLLDELRSDAPMHARSLAAAVMDHALSRPVDELVEPEPLAAAIAGGLRASAEDPNLESWLRQSISSSLDWSEEQLDGTVEERIPAHLAASIKRLARRPFRSDPALLRSVLLHRRVRDIMGRGLEKLLVDFGHSLLAAIPGAGRAGALSGIMDVAKSMAGMVRAELDRQLEGRVREFVDDTLDRGVKKWTESLSSPAMARRAAEIRGDIVDILLQQPVRHYLAIPRAADEAALALALAEELRELAGDENLESEMTEAVREAMRPLEGRSVASILEGSDLVESWRLGAEELLASYLADLFESEPFGRWLGDLEKGSAVKTRQSRKRSP